ncbi:MAG: hypothetical protein JSR66_19670 [Proteobacteria bacterium]|nr:hypothetical protein [Pseudomonadota bacterium]
MKTHQVTWLPVLLCLAVMGAAHTATRSIKAEAAPNSKQPTDIMNALAATGPHASLGDQAKVLEQLVGTWDVEYKDILKDGREQHRIGQFIMSWALAGRATEIVWIVEPSEGRQEREVYTAIQYFDSKTRSWPMVFIDPEHASTAKFTGGATLDGRMVLQTSDLGRPQNRWSFTANGPDSVVFRDEYSSDGGETWKTLSEDHMKRQRPDATR